MRISRPRHVVVAAVGSGLLASCVYYNTLYNAEALYREAEGLRSTGQDSAVQERYREVVAKATGAGVALAGGVEVIVGLADAAGATVAVAPQANAAIANNPGINNVLRVNMLLCPLLILGPLMTIRSNFSIRPEELGRRSCCLAVPVQLQSFSA